MAGISHHRNDKNSVKLKKRKRRHSQVELKGVRATLSNQTLNCAFPCNCSRKKHTCCILYSKKFNFTFDAWQVF